MIIGLSGKIGSGKDTVADIICKLDETFEKKSFAYKLKYICHILTGLSMQDMLTQEGKNIYMHKWGMTVGELQQRLGTEAIRNNIHDNAWIISLFSNYNNKMNWIITDVRFPNEAQAILDNDGYLIRIGGDPAKINENSTRDKNHPSEISLDDWSNWSYNIKNDGTIEELQEKVTKIYKEIVDNAI